MRVSEATAYASFLVAACVLSYCAEADANPVTLRFRNSGKASDPTYQAIVAHAPGLADVQRAVTCPPGMECMIVVPIAPGSYTVNLTAKANGLESAPSNTMTKVVAPAVPCDFDYDHDGALLGLDFKMWLADFKQGYWGGADFATFVNAFGKPCAP